MRIIHGEKAHSCYMGRDAYAVHTDLYDNLDVIPFDKLEGFFRENLEK